MSRRLQMAGMSLWALWLPACSSLNKSNTEKACAPCGSTGYVVANRSNGLREQIAKAPKYPGFIDPKAQARTAAESPMVPIDPPDAQLASMKPPVEVLPPPSSNLADQLVIPDTPAGDAAPIVPPAPPMAPAAPMSPTTIASPGLPTAPIAPVEAVQQAGGPPIIDPRVPVVQPPWPNLGGEQTANERTEFPVANLPEPSPSISMTPAIPPAPPVVPLPDPVLRPDAGTSLKVTEPVNPAPTQQQLTPVGVPVPPATAAASPDAIILNAMRALQNNQPREAAEHLKQLDAVNQEAMMQLLPLLMRLGEKSLNALSPEELAIMIDRMQTVSTLLKSKAALRADNVSFCRGVRKFADVDPYDPKHEFRPGDMVFLYAELKNFTCETVAANLPYNANQRGCHIRLGTNLELRDARNSLVWKIDLSKTDFAQTPPQDYYHTYRFCIPDKLPPGVYTLWLNIVDKPTGRSVRKPIEMRVGNS